MLKVYAIQTKCGAKSPDIVWWDNDIKINNKIRSCLAFFYKKRDAQNYLNWIKKTNNKFNLTYKIIEYSPNPFTAISFSERKRLKLHRPSPIQQ